MQQRRCDTGLLQVLMALTQRWCIAHRGACCFWPAGMTASHSTPQQDPLGLCCLSPATEVQQTAAAVQTMPCLAPSAAMQQVGLAADSSSRSKMDIGTLAWLPGSCWSALLHLLLSLTRRMCSSRHCSQPLAPCYVTTDVWPYHACRGHPVLQLTASACFLFVCLFVSAASPTNSHSNVAHVRLLDSDFFRCSL
jgi:hypothetical protein